MWCSLAAFGKCHDFNLLHWKHIGHYIHFMFLTLSCHFGLLALPPFTSWCKEGIVIVIMTHFSHVFIGHLLCTRYWGMQRWGRPMASRGFHPWELFSHLFVIFSLGFLYLSFSRLLLVPGTWKVHCPPFPHSGSHTCRFFCQEYFLYPRPYHSILSI